MRWLETGKILRSASGRELSPAPKIDCSSNRKTVNTLKRVNQWLKENAIIEARSVGNEFAAFLMEQVDIENISQSDIEEMNMVLFDSEFQTLTESK